MAQRRGCKSRADVPGTATSPPDEDPAPSAERHARSEADKSGWSRGRALNRFPLPVTVLAGARVMPPPLADTFAAAVVADLVAGFANGGDAALAVGVIALCTG